MTWLERRRKMFHKLCKSNGIKGKDKKFIKGVINSFNKIVWMIAKFMCMYWIYMRVLERIGFEKTILTAMLLITILLRSNLKPPTV